MSINPDIVLNQQSHSHLVLVESEVYPFMMWWSSFQRKIMQPNLTSNQYIHISAFSYDLIPEFRGGSIE